MARSRTTVNTKSTNMFFYHKLSRCEIKLCSLAAVTSILFLFSSCQRDKTVCDGHNERTKIYLPAKDRAKTPYFDNADFDTISYTSDKGDTVTFALVKTDS